MEYLFGNYDKSNAIGPRGSSKQDHVDFENGILFLLTGLGPVRRLTEWFRHCDATNDEEILKRYTAESYRHLMF